MKITWSSRAAVSVFAVVAFYTRLNAEDHHFPDQYISIQAAMDAAQPGDHVLIADGRWFVRNLNFNGKDITVRSASGKPANCVLNGGQYVFRLENGETTSAVIRDLTIYGAWGPEGAGAGAGAGAGILCRGSSATILYNLFLHNQNGIALLDGSSAVIAGNTIASARGILVMQSSAFIANNRIMYGFQDADADKVKGAVGAGLRIEWSNVTMANNLVTHNVARGVFSDASYGGGMSEWYSNALVVNNTVENNYAVYGPDLWVGFTPHNHIGTVLGFSWYSPPSHEYSCLPDCIDAGDNSLLPPDVPDLDQDGDTTEPLPFDVNGRPRFVDDPSTPDAGPGTAPRVDGGAIEHMLDGDCNLDWTLGLQDVPTVIGCIDGPSLPYFHFPGYESPQPRAPGCGCADMDLDGDVDLTDLAAFINNFSGK